MAKPQQPEVRRSGRVPALDPDATEAARSADRHRGVTDPNAPIPEDQRPGHHPDHDQDKPDLDDFAARLGVASEGNEPEDAPHVDDEAPPPESSRSRPSGKLLLLGPAIGFVVVRRVVRRLWDRRKD